MSTFEDREKGYENKFAHEQEQEFKIALLRNKLLGQWAAELLGKEGESAEAYANALVVHSVENDLYESVIALVVKDLQDSGNSATERDVRLQAETLGDRARKEFSAS